MGMNHQQRNAFLGLVNKLHLHPTIKKKWCLTTLKRLPVEYLKEE
jgi:hypothetical protein